MPYEFRDASALPPRDAIEMRPPPGFRKSHNVAAGTWSDDGAQALCVLASLLHCDRLDVEDLGRRLRNWCDWGYMAVEGEVFDIGVQTSESLRALAAGTSAAESGGIDERSNGNGSLMRVLPLALWHRGTDAELVDDAHLQSRVTHAHPRSQVCCALYCLWARRILQEAGDPWGSALTTLRELYGADAARSTELEQSIVAKEGLSVAGSGYVVDCLRSARWAMAQGGYEQAVKSAIALGNDTDTDTTACVTGGIAGLRDGLEAIPKRWREDLRESELFLPLLEQLLRRA